MEAIRNFCGCGRKPQHPDAKTYLPVHETSVIDTAPPSMMQGQVQMPPPPNPKVQVAFGLCNLFVGIAFGIVFLVAASKTVNANEGKFMRWHTWYFVEGICTLVLQGCAGAIVFTTACFMMSAMNKDPHAVHGNPNELSSNDKIAAFIGIIAGCEGLMLGLTGCFAFSWFIVGVVLMVQTGYTSTSVWWVCTVPVMCVFSCCIGALQQMAQVSDASH